MTEMEQDKMTQQSLVVFLEQLGAEANDLNSIFKKVIIKIVLSFFIFYGFVYYFDYHAVSLSLSSFFVVSEKGLVLLLEQS